MAIAHVGVGVSVVLLFVFGARIAFVPSALSITVFLVVGILSWLLIRVLGFLYLLSSTLQEFCILFAATILLPMGVLWAAVLTSAVYALAHLIDPSGWQWKVGITFVWGVASVLLYAWLQEPLLNISLHAIGGAVLIRAGLLLKRDLSVKEARHVD